MSDPAPQTAITKAQDSPAFKLNAFLRPRMKNIADYARGIVKPEALVRLACFEMSRPESKWLTEVSFDSIYASLIIAAQLGLEISSVRGEAYLVPFKGKCTLMPGYRGLMKLALRSGEVKAIRARIVYRGDNFVVKYGSHEEISHEPQLGRELPNGEAAPEIIAAYAIAVMANGEHQFDVMDGWELDKHRQASAQANGPAWKAWPEEMYRKAPVRRLSKYLPLDELAAKGMKVDELIVAGQADRVGDYIDVPAEEGAPVEPTPQASAIQRAAERAK